MQKRSKNNSSCPKRYKNCKNKLKRSKTGRNELKLSKDNQNELKTVEIAVVWGESHLCGDGITKTHAINPPTIVLVSALLECARRSMHRFGQRLHPCTGGNRFPMALRGPWVGLSMTKPNL